MKTGGTRTGSLADIAARLKADLAALMDAAAASRPSTAARKSLDAELRVIIGQMDDFLRDVDPVRQPRFIFDPGNPRVVGRFIALAMIAQPRAALLDIKPFYGSGVYALYYTGPFPAYKSIRGTETPIYVGKADPKSRTAKLPIEQGEKLYKRLKDDHLKNISKASGTLNPADFGYRSLVVQSGWQDGAEDYLVHLFKPVWNSESGICYGFGKHGDDPATRGNLRSPWDTLHPGRDWAHRDSTQADARPRKRILAELEAHFAKVAIYRKLDQVLRNFVEELRQL